MGQGREWKEPLRGADRWRIGVTGLTPGAGVSFLTICMAEYFAQERESSPAVAELGSGGIYDSLGMDRRFALREYCSFYRAAAGDANIRRLANWEDGINWALRLPEEEEPMGYREALRLVYGLSGDAVFFDFSGREDEEGWLLLKEMDLVVGVVDPLPQRLLKGRSRLDRWKLSGLPMKWLINKDNGGIDQRELERFLKIKAPARVPCLPAEPIYQAQFAGASPWSVPEIRKALLPTFVSLFREIS